MRITALGTERPDGSRSGGVRSFILAYRFLDVDGGRRTNEFRYTIGTYPAWSVAAARAEAKEWRRKIDRGETHPMAERVGKRNAARQARHAETYAEAVEEYIRRYQIGTKQNTTADEVRRVLLRGSVKENSLERAPSGS